MLTLTKGYFYPTCNKELKYNELCAIVGHFQMSCRYCHTDIKKFYKDIKYEKINYEFPKGKSVNKGE